MAGEITTASLVEAVEWALAIHFSQNRQPCMSGDPRDRLSAQQRRHLSDAGRAALAAVARAADFEVAAGVLDDRVLWRRQYEADVNCPPAAKKMTDDLERAANTLRALAEAADE